MTEAQNVTSAIGALMKGASAKTSTNATWTTNARFIGDLPGHVMRALQRPIEGIAEGVA